MYEQIHLQKYSKYNVNQLFVEIGLVNNINMYLITIINNSTYRLKQEIR